MSGHSKWSTIKRKKGEIDAKRGNIFTKIIKELTVAAKAGGGDPNGNPRLRSAVDSAKEANMPKDNIERAIKKGTGELEGVSYEEIRYEGYGPGGTAIILDVLTDNKNRTVAEVRHAFTKYGGNLGEDGSVGWMFTRKGLIEVEKGGVKEDALMGAALENGAEDFVEEEGGFSITSEVNDFESLKAAILKAGFKPVVAEVTLIPQTYIKLEGKDANKMINLMDVLEENDDVQKVYSNFDIDKETLEAM